MLRPDMEIRETKEIGKDDVTVSLETHYQSQVVSSRTNLSTGPD